MKNRHNKKRNTALLYEILIKELTKSVIDENNHRRQKVLGLLKEHFEKSSTLFKELQIYKSLYELDLQQPDLVEKIVTEAHSAYSKLDKQKVNKSQTSLINAINKGLSRGSFLNFIPNYRQLATIQQFFNTPSPKKKIILEQKIKDTILNENKESEGLKPIDKLVYRTFVKNFNNKYGTLLKEQQETLNKYISSFADGEVEFRVFLNNKLEDIKEGIGSFLSIADNKNTSIIDKTNEVKQIVESFKNDPVDEHLVGQVLRLQTLVEEIKKDEH